MMRVDEIRDQIANLAGQERQAKMTADQALASHSLDEALASYAKAKEIQSRIELLTRALESAETQDRTASEAAVKAESAADGQRAVDLAAGDRVKAAGAADKAFVALSASLKAVAAPTSEILNCVHRCVQTHRLSSLRQGEQHGMLATHARHDGGAFAFAVAQSIYRALAESGYLDAMYGFIEFKIDPTAANTKIVDAARISAEGLRIRLGLLPTDI